MLKKFLSLIKSQAIYSQGTIMFITVTLANIFNLFYHLYMVRVLSPQDYGILNTIIALTMFLSMPTGTLQTTLTKFIAHYHGLKDKDAIIKVLKGMSIRIFCLGILVIFLIFVFASGIERYFKLPSKAPVYSLMGIIAVTLIAPFTFAGLQGLQKFLALGISAISSSISKLGFGILFIVLGGKVVGALNAFSLSVFVGILIALIPLWKAITKLQIKELTTKVEFKQIYKYLLPVGMASTSFIFLTSIDLILVKHFFTPIQAGFYSIAQMVGKVILFFPSAISIVMFPKVANSYARKEKTANILKHSLFYVGFLTLIAVVVCILFPKLLLMIFTGKVYNECIPLIRLFSSAMGLFSLLNIFLMYYLSINKIRRILPFIFGLIIEAVLIYIFHGSLHIVLYIVNLVALSLFILNLFLLRKVGNS
jgi:O-antigen/teichoic acid export membrane protein